MSGGWGKCQEDGASVKKVWLVSGGELVSGGWE